jgi:hypothetical protein
MQQSILTRYTALAIFLFTCCLTMDVNARELGLGNRPAPKSKMILTPDALQLLSDANALLEGFTPAKVTSFELTPRRKVKKTMPVRIENSRVKVKFADELQIRLDVHNQLYSKTGRTSSTIADLVNALGVTLTPVHTDSQASIDALIRRAELHSGKQQPDIAGTYWVEGDSSAVNVAAELFYTLEEVEWVMYKPLLIRPTGPVAETDYPTTNQVQPKIRNAQSSAQTREPEFGACWFSKNDCENRLEKNDCFEFGGTFLGESSVCIDETIRQPLNSSDSDWCKSDISIEVQEHMQRLLNDGTWDRYRARNIHSNRATQFVKVTVHTVGFNDGTGHLDQPTINTALANLTANFAPIELVFCQSGETILLDCDAWAMDADEDVLRTIANVPNTMNIYFVPAWNGGSAVSSFPNYGVQGIVIDNSIATTILTHEVGHYFGLFHTFETLWGTECVDRTNCSFAGDLFCDTPADDNAGFNQVTCAYNGTALDVCGSGMPYTPSATNFMSYAPAVCVDTFTTEQFAVMLSIAETDRLDHLSPTICDAPPPSGPAYACEPTDALPPGPQDAVCCVIQDWGGGATGCIDTDQATCNTLNGVMFVADPPDEGAGICDNFTECPLTGALYDECGDAADYVTYFTGDCYIDQSAYPQNNRPNALSNGCLDTNGAQNAFGDYFANSGASVLDPGVVNLTGDSCCSSISTLFAYCLSDATIWNAACASYAIDDAFFNGTYCGRPPNAVNPCAAPYGPTHTNIRQPSVNLDFVGTNIGIEIIANPGDVGFEVEVEDIYGVRTINLYFTNGAIETIVSRDISEGTTLEISQLASWIEFSALANNITLEASCCAWAGCCYGDESSDACVDAWTNACSTRANYLASLSRTTVTNDINLFVTIYTTAIVPGAIAQCASPNGLPSVTRVTPDPTTGSPDFAQMGLMMWMTEERIPFLPNSLGGDRSQEYALPTSTSKLTAQEIHALYQLVPWPMGGADSLDNALPQMPPLVSPDQTISWNGVGLDLFPKTVNPGGFGQTEPYLGAYGYGQQWADAGVGPLTAEGEVINCAFGNNVKVAVLDWSAYLQEQTNTVGLNIGGKHAELSHVILEGEDTGHDAIDLVFDENLGQPDQLPNWFPFTADHGTAMLGIIGAQWGPDSAPGVDISTRLAKNIGVLGLVPDADLYFFPLASTDEATGREATAWLHALGTLGVGDVLCAGYRPIIVDLGRPNINYWDDTNGYLELANNLGISTIIQAGFGPGDTSGGVDLGGLEPSGGDQGAIVATAVSPSNTRKRMATGERSSNYSTTQDYSSVTVSGWGMAVTTCGKGPNRDNYLGYSTCLYTDPTDAHEVHSYSYTNNFGGTAAAAAVATGTVAMVQAFTKQIFSVPMSTAITRQLIAGGRYQGIDKDGEMVMPWAPPNTEEGTSECDESNEYPQNSWDTCGAGVWRTGNFANPRFAMINAIYDPIFDTPNIDVVTVIRGNLLLGNIYSLATDDGNLFGVTGVSTGANHAYSLDDFPAVPGSYVRYPSSGNVTDIYLTGELETTLPSNNELNVEINFEETQPDQFYLRCEMWDYRRRSWEQASGTTIVVRGTEDVDLVIENASRFIDRTTTQYHLRLTTAVTNLPGSGTQPPYPIMYDQILVKTGLTQIPNP